MLRCTDRGENTVPTSAPAKFCSDRMPSPLSAPATGRSPLGAIPTFAAGDGPAAFGCHPHFRRRRPAICDWLMSGLSCPDAVLRVRVMPLDLGVMVPGSGRAGATGLATRIRPDADRSPGVWWRWSGSPQSAQYRTHQQHLRP